MKQSDFDGLMYVLKTLYPDFAQGFVIWQQFMDEQIDAVEMDRRLVQLSLEDWREKADD